MAHAGFHTPQQHSSGSAEYSGSAQYSGSADPAMLFRLYVSCIPPMFTEAGLWPLFSQWGMVRDLSICRNSLDGMSLGSAFVSYGSMDEAQRAVFALHRKVFLMGSSFPLEVRFARSYCYIDAGNGPANNRQLFFKSAPPHVTEHDLRTVFSVFGSVEDICLFRDARSSAFRGSGLVTMHTRSQASHVISELDGRHYMLGSLLPLSVKWADPELRAKKQEARRNNDIIHRGLFVARIPYAATEAHVEALFAQFGLVTQVTLIRDYVGAPLSKGFGFVTLSRADEATAAIAALNERHTWHGMPRAMVVTFMNRRLQRQHLRQQNMQRAVAASEAAGLVAAGPGTRAHGMASSSWTSSCGFMPHRDDHDRVGSNSSSCSDRPDAPPLHDHVASSPSPPPGYRASASAISEPAVVMSAGADAPPEGCEPAAVKLIFKKVPRQCSEEQLKGLLEKVGGSVAEVGFLEDAAHSDQAHCTAYVWYTTLAAAEHALANMRLVKALTGTGKQQGRTRRGSDPGALLRVTRSLPLTL
ncbi:hypothetical protein FOA52_012030 [Chlamydomonas sp. UWO 241]|nr:hypothetical protein FOA52_012030 [Chlamydomonas sp. UWO 241]